MELLPKYQRVLESFGLSVNKVNEGSDKEMAFVSIDGAPIEISGHKLILPTKEALRNPNWDEYMAFHPLSENVLRGESVVLQTVRKWAQYTLNAKAAAIMYTLIELAADVDRHETLTTKQREFLQLVPDAAKRTVDDIDSLLDKLDPDTPQRLISIFLKRGGNLKGKSYKRLGVIYSPIMDEKDNAKREVYGVQFRKKDFKPLFDLLEFIMPGINEQAYDFGSDEHEAPYFHALCGAYVNIAKQLNKIVRKFQRIWGDEFEEMLTDVDWFEDMGELSKCRGLIPSLKGNEGALDEKEEARNAEMTAAPSQPAEEHIGGVKKPNWSDKKAAAVEADKSTSFIENMGKPATPAATTQAAPQKPVWGAQAQPQAEQPKSNSFMDMVQPTQVGAWGGQPSEPQRQASAYGQPQNTAWGQPQQQTWGQPAGRQASSYNNANNWNASGNGSI